MDENQKKEETLFDKHRENIYFRWGLTAFVVIAAAILLGQLVTKLPSFIAFGKAFLKTLSPVLYGLIIAYLLHPIVGRIEKLLTPQLGKIIKRQDKAENLSRSIGIMASLVLAGLLIWALIAMVLPQLIESIATIVGNLPTYYDTLSKWVLQFIEDAPEIANATEGVMEQVYSYLSNFLENVLLPKLQTMLMTLTTSIVGLVKGMLNLIIGVIISIYLLSSQDKFLAQGKKIIYAMLGRKRGGYILNVCTFANRVFGGFIGGKIIDSAIIGVLCFIVLSIMNMPYTLLISIIVGVTNIIPFFGPFIGAIPSALLLLVIDPMQCLYFVIFVIILQQLDGNVIGPLILGDATGLDSIWVVVSILVFGNLWGFFGMIVGVPLFAVIYKIVTECVNHMLEKRGLSTVTDDYEKWNYPPREEISHWNPTSRRQKKKAEKRLKFHHQAPGKNAESEGTEEKTEQ